MKKIYHLQSCNTCQRILKEIQPTPDFILQEIKEEAITTAQLEEMHAFAGSYEALFSKRARLYKEYDLKNQNLTEEDFKKYILEHYTFLKRPVILVNDQIFIGNAKKTIAAAKEAIS